MTDDLSPLALSPARRNALEAAIAARAEPILTSRAGRGTVLILAHWIRPALAAAATIAVVALGTLLAGNGDEAVASPPTTAEALGFPAAVAAWIEVGRTPSVEELAITMEEATR